MRNLLLLSPIPFLALACTPPSKPATQPTETPIVYTDRPKPADPLSDNSREPELYQAKINQLMAELKALEATKAAAPAPATTAPAEVAAPPVAPRPLPAPMPPPQVDIGPALPLDDVTAKVSRRLDSDPKDVANQLDMALLNYLKEEPSPEPKRIATLPADDRELVSAVIDALSNLRASVRTNPNATNQSRIKPLTELADRLRSRSDLAVPTVVLTRGVSGFGVYEPMPANLSSRGETPTVLYTEVANFSPRLNDRRFWETHLTSAVAVYDEAGHSVWSTKPTTITDTSRNRRSDYFLATPLRIPPVPPGKYTLKVTLTDLNSNHFAENSLSLESR